MISFLGWVSVLILLFLAGVHLYWAFGGKWGFEAVIPIDKNGKNLLNPKWIDSLLVAVILCVIAFLYAVKATIINIEFIPQLINKYGLPIISFVFVARAIGDFKYVGFFKKYNSSIFAKKDTYYFSPLCLFLAVVGFLLF